MKNSCVRNGILVKGGDQVSGREDGRAYTVPAIAGRTVRSHAGAGRPNPGPPLHSLAAAPRGM